MADQKLSVRDRVLIVRLVQLCAERGLFPWVLVEGSTVRVGIEGRGEIRVPIQTLRSGMEGFLGHLSTFAHGGQPYSSEITVLKGDGRFPEEGWSQLELAWLEFQVWRLDRGDFDADLVPGC